MSRPLSLSEAAEALGCSTDTVARLIESGRLQAFTVGTSKRKHWRVTTEAIAEYQQGNQPKVAPKRTRRKQAIKTNRNWV